MDIYLNHHKNNKKNELNVLFNDNIILLKKKLQININNVHKKSIHITIKTHNIKFLNQKYNNDVVKLKNNLKNDIEKIDLLTSYPQRTTPGKFAVLIGINYKNTDNELNGCINDTNNIKNLLNTKYGFNNFLILTDNSPFKPIKKNIILALNFLLEGSIPGDSLVLLNSGHGFNADDTNNDELDGLDEYIVPLYAKTMNDCISDDELNKIIKNKLKTGVKLFALFDSCFSGTVFDLKYMLDSNNDIIINPNYDETLGRVIMISGCTDEQTSADAFIKNKYCGAMTNAFIHIINNYGSITLKQLVNNMQVYLLENGFEQTPLLSWGKNTNIETEPMQL